VIPEKADLAPGVLKIEKMPVIFKEPSHVVFGPTVRDNDGLF
jgi:hypothetical protein